MVEPKLEIDRRLDRLELAISTMAEELGMDNVNQILQGEQLEGAQPDDSIEGSHRYPATEQQEEPGPEVSRSGNDED